MHIARAVVVALVLLGGYLGPNSDVYITQPAIAVAALLLVKDVISEVPKLHPIIAFIVLIFGGLSVHRVFAGPVLEYGEQKFVSFITTIAFSAAIAALVSLPRRFVSLAFIWVTIGIYLSVMSLVNSDSLRADVFGMNPIWVARIIAAGFVLLIWLSWTKRIRLLWSIIIGITLLLGLFGTGSRGPLVAALIGTAVIVLASKISASSKILMLGAGALAAFILMRLPVFTESRIGGILSGDIDGGNARARMWDQSVPVVADHPLGVGYGNWALHVDGFRGLYPHNIFLEVFVEQGIIVGTFFVLVVFVILLQCLKYAKYSREAVGVSAWLMAEIVHVSVSGDLKAPIFFFVLSLAFLVVVRLRALGYQGKRPFLRQSSRNSFGAVRR